MKHRTVTTINLAPGEEVQYDRPEGLGTFRICVIVAHHDTGGYTVYARRVFKSGGTTQGQIVHYSLPESTRAAVRAIIATVREDTP